jgi:iron complex transport system substrate-binding protein
MTTSWLRRFALLAALLAVTAGLACAPDQQSVTDQVAPSAPAATESDPGFVVVLDDFAAANVMALGVTPDLAYDAFGYATTAALYDAAGVTPKPYGQSLAVEEIAAADPDVIVGVSLPTTVEQKDTLAELGTTAILDYTGDWRSALRATAKALGREDRAARVEALVDSGVTALKDDLAGAGRSGAVVSVLAGSPDGTFSPPVKTSLGSLIAGLGLERPAPQRADVSATAPFVNISPENLTANDGAALFLMKGRGYPVEGITGSPLYPKLKAVQADRVYQVSGEMWFGASPISVQWVLDDLRRTLLEDSDPLAESAAGERLQALVAATGNAR